MRKGRVFLRRKIKGKAIVAVMSRTWMGRGNMVADAFSYSHSHSLSILGGYLSHGGPWEVKLEGD